ncbi:MAG: biotin--[acetyl-CoA-carboxylase] ligase [Alphaproteobacteria bacterium]|nr:biotin--[acetyl-CoA-carboxylase] ligase [Alphaproteobacteria bacterium]
MNLPAGFHRVAFEEIGSTNTEALRLAETGAPELTLVTARRQLAGRGRRGRAFDSPTGNLFASIVLRPDRPYAVVSQLSFVAALAVGDLLDRLALDGAVGFKWPNDVQVDGAKISGILLEGGVGHLVAGIGVNLLHHPGGTPYPATSVLAKGGKAADLEEATAILAEAFLERYRCWLADGFEPAREAWLARAVGIGREVRVALGDGRIDAGVFSALDETGALVLTRDGAVRKINAGEVFFAA